MTDKPILALYGGLDTRESFGIEKESGILVYKEAKNIDIKGKSVRRARGQECVFELDTGGWLGLASHEINKNYYLKGIDDQGNYWSNLAGGSGDEVEPPPLLDVSQLSYSGYYFNNGKRAEGLNIIDGTDFYFVYRETEGTTGFKIVHYTMINENFNTATLVGTSPLFTQDVLPTGLFINSDKTRAYVVGQSNKKIYQLEFGTAGDVTTLTHSGKTLDLFLAAVGVILNSTETKLFVLKSGGTAQVIQYDMLSAGDVSTAVDSG